MRLCNIERGVPFVRIASVCYLTLAACLASTSPTLSQPVPLRPATPGSGAVEEPATATAPGQQAPQPDARSSRLNSPPASTGISVSTLPVYDPSMHGTLDPTAGGFARDLWQGAPRPLVETLLPHLPVATGLPTLTRLVRRLLLSAADPPQGAATGASLLALRLERLAAAGEMEAVEELIVRAGDATDEELIRHVRSSILLARNDLGGACEIAGNMVQNSPAPYWLKLSGFCQALAGETNAAILSAGLVAEEDRADTAYQALMAALTGDTGITLHSLPEPALLHLAMMRVTGEPVPQDVTMGASALGLRVVTGMPNASLSLRIAAAEKAVATGAFDAAALAQIYAAAPATASSGENPAASEDGLTGSLANAQHYREVQRQETADGRLQALAVAWATSRENGTFATVARVHHAAAQSVPADYASIWVAGDITRALLAAGDIGGAARWYQLARSAASQGDPAAQRIAADIWPLIRLALSGQEMTFNVRDVEAWVADLVPQPAAERRQKGELMLAALAALGFEVPERLWNRLAVGMEIQPGPFPSPPATLLALLDTASGAGRVGETILLAAVCLGENAEGIQNPVILGAAIKALVAVGLVEDAHMLAVEAAMKSGL